MQTAAERLMDELNNTSAIHPTITVKRSDLEKVVLNTLMIEEWSNYSCIGYVIAAGEKAGLDPGEIKSLISKMHSVFDSLTLDQAAKYYTSSNY